MLKTFIFLYSWTHSTQVLNANKWDTSHNFAFFFIILILVAFKILFTRETDWTRREQSDTEMFRKPVSITEVQKFLKHPDTLS